MASARRASSTLPNKTEYSPKVSTWLGHGHLASNVNGKATNWKGQYRLRHNWSRGVCRLSEVKFPPRPDPPNLAKLCAGFVFTADSAHGLRVWAAKDPAICLATAPFSERNESSKSSPTALAVCDLQEAQEVVVGFEDGHYKRYIMNPETSQLELRSSHAGSSQGAITAMALSSPYILMVSHDKILSLHCLDSEQQDSAQPGEVFHSQELASLKADNMIAPMTLCLRKSTFEIVATIVYSFLHIGCGWSLGIQELHFSKDGQQLESRLTSTVDSQYGIGPSRNLAPSVRRRHSATADPEPLGHSSAETPALPSILHKQPPTSMSYSHPYLLTSHADNTLTMYLVVSNSSELFVRGGQRLWGHTSSVSTVQVTNRGKAISVGARGDEIRIWELEMAISSLGTSRPFNEESSIQVNPEHEHKEVVEGLGLDLRDDYYTSTPTPTVRSRRREIGGLELDSDSDRAQESPTLGLHECVGFDEERVFLLREKTVGTQLLECYDFT